MTVDYCMLDCFHTSFAAQLHMFPRNMCVLNRYANYPNGNQEAWPLQLADLFLFHFSCNTSQSLMMKHNVLWRLYVAGSATANWIFLLHQTDLTLQQYDVTNNTSALEASNCNTCKCIVPLCISTHCCCCNWNEHHVNQTHLTVVCCSKSVTQPQSGDSIAYITSKF